MEPEGYSGKVPDLELRKTPRAKTFSATANPRETYSTPFKHPGVFTRNTFSGMEHLFRSKRQKEARNPQTQTVQSGHQKGNLYLNDSSKKKGRQLEYPLGLLDSMVTQKDGEGRSPLNLYQPPGQRAEAEGEPFNAHIYLRERSREKKKGLNMKEEMRRCARSLFQDLSLTDLDSYNEFLEKYSQQILDRDSRRGPDRERESSLGLLKERFSRLFGKEDRRRRPKKCRSSLEIRGGGRGVIQINNFFYNQKDDFERLEMDIYSTDYKQKKLMIDLANEKYNQSLLSLKRDSVRSGRKAKEAPSLDKEIDIQVDGNKLGTLVISSENFQGVNFVKNESLSKLEFHSKPKRKIKSVLMRKSKSHTLGGQPGQSVKKLVKLKTDLGCSRASLKRLAGTRKKVADFFLKSKTTLDKNLLQRAGGHSRQSKVGAENKDLEISFSMIRRALQQPGKTQDRAIRERSNSKSISALKNEHEIRSTSNNNSRPRKSKFSDISRSGICEISPGFFVDASSNKRASSKLETAQKKEKKRKGPSENKSSKQGHKQKKRISSKSKSRKMGSLKNLKKKSLKNIKRDTDRSQKYRAEIREKRRLLELTNKSPNRLDKTIRSLSKYKRSRSKKDKSGLIHVPGEAASSYSKGEQGRVHLKREYHTGGGPTASTYKNSDFLKYLMNKQEIYEESVLKTETLSMMTNSSSKKTPLNIFGEARRDKFPPSQPHPESRKLFTQLKKKLSENQLELLQKGLKIQGNFKKNKLFSKTLNIKYSSHHSPRKEVRRVVIPSPVKVEVEGPPNLFVSKRRAQKSGGDNRRDLMEKLFSPKNHASIYDAREYIGNYAVSMKSNTGHLEKGRASHLLCDSTPVQRGDFGGTLGLAISLKTPSHVNGSANTFITPRHTTTTFQSGTPCLVQSEFVKTGLKQSEVSNKTQLKEKLIQQTKERKRQGKRKKTGSLKILKNRKLELFRRSGQKPQAKRGLFKSRKRLPSNFWSKKVREAGRSQSKVYHQIVRYIDKLKT